MECVWFVLLAGALPFACEVFECACLDVEVCVCGGGR